MITVLVITGILAAVAATFIQAPIQGYMDTTRRATLTDTADTALRRIGRDLQSALPNSVRIAPGGLTLEYLDVRTGGRYRTQPSGGATTCPVGGSGAGFNDTLEIGTTDTCFHALGGTPNLAAVTAADSLVIFNLGPGVANADAYAPVGAGSNRVVLGAAPVAGGGASPEDVFTFPLHTFVLGSPSNRFQIVSGPVSYQCDLVAGTLTRYSGYAIAAAQPVVFPGAVAATLASNVTGCNFSYTPGLSQNAGVVSLTLTLSIPSNTTPETVTLFSEVHVNNSP